MIRVAVIGAGAWGINHVRVLADEPSCTLAAIADPEPHAAARARLLAPAVNIVADADQIFADRSIDAVVIAAPAPTHAALARSALLAGKHVLIEKPLAMSLAESLSVAEVARASHRIAMIGHLMVYHPAVVRLRALLHSGELGELHYLHSTRVNLGRLRSDENALWSFGPHDLSMIDFLLGKMPHRVAARGQSVLQPGVEDVVFLTLRYRSGEMAHIHLSWLNPRKERRLTAVCSRKMVEFDDVAAEKLRIYDKGYDRPPEFTDYAQFLTLRDGDVYIPKLPMEEPLQLQLREFLTCIRDQRAPITDLASGIRVTAVLEAAQRSLASDGVPVEIETNLVEFAAISG